MRNRKDAVYAHSFFATLAVSFELFGLVIIANFNAFETYCRVNPFENRLSLFLHLKLSVNLVTHIQINDSRSGHYFRAENIEKGFVDRKQAVKDLIFAHNLAIQLIELRLAKQLVVAFFAVELLRLELVGDAPRTDRVSTVYQDSGLAVVID